MKKSVKLWLKALRSGDYEQGQEYLHQENKFCCLGVACDLYNKTHKKKLITKTCTCWGIKDVTVYDDDTILLPTKVQKWLGLKTRSGIINYDNSLTSYNDKFGYTFDKIADIIEEQQEKLFT